jgi:NADPH:quinone reductase
MTSPHKDQVLVRQTAVGVNHADIRYRNGHAHVDRFPFVNGFEAAGTIEAVGSGRRGHTPGAISICCDAGHQRSHP